MSSACTIQKKLQLVKVVLFIRIDRYVISTCISIVLFAAAGDGHLKYLTPLEFYHTFSFKAGTTGMLEPFLPARRGITDSKTKDQRFSPCFFHGGNLLSAAAGNRTAAGQARVIFLPFYIPSEWQ